MITDLSTTAASNSPAGSDSPVDGDNFIRALSAFVASLQTGSGNGVTAITSPGFIPNSATIPTNGIYLKAANNPALSSNTTLRWDVGSAGNHTFAAPSSGRTANFTAFTGAAGTVITSAAAQSAYKAFSVNGTDYSFVGSVGAAGQLVNDTAGIGEFIIRTESKDFRLSVNAGTSTAVRVATAGNVTIAAPTAGVGFTVNGTAATGRNGVQLSGTTTGFHYLGFDNTAGNALIGIDNSAGAGLMTGTDAYSLVLGTTNARSVWLGTNNTARVQIGGTGNVTIAAPTAGVGFTQTGFAGSNAANFNGGSSGTFSVTTTGGATTNENIRATGTASTIGYGAGAGGTVTQATSKATGVTLNRGSGEIVMNGAALGSAAVVGFLLTNSTIVNGDVVIVNMTSAGAFDPTNYRVWNGPAVGGGSTAILVENRSAGSLSEAITLHFAVIKGALT